MFAAQDAASASRVADRAQQGGGREGLGQQRMPELRMHGFFAGPSHAGRPRQTNQTSPPVPSTSIHMS
jgi:hypothetical protein